MIVLYRPSTNKIIWKGTGPFFYQHDVDIINNHSIAVFNNNVKVFEDGPKIDGNNEVIIYDFKKKKYSTYLNKSLIKNDVRTATAGRSEIINNGDLFIEERKAARIIYFNKDGSLRWTYLNRADNGNQYDISWSRILYDQDIKNVKKFLNSKGKCND